VVELNEKKRCPLHPNKKPADIRLAVPADVESVKASMMVERARVNRLTRIRWIVSILGIGLLCAAVIYLGQM
jgi:hypothetical protein